MGSKEGREADDLEEPQVGDLLLNNKKPPGGVCSPMCLVCYFDVHLELNKVKIHASSQPCGPEGKTTISKQMPVSLPLPCEWVLVFKKRSPVNL